jgi:SGNH domain-containing protein
LRTVHAAARILRIFSFALVVALAPCAAARAGPPSRDPTPHVDLADVPQSPLDIRTVAFGQRGTEMVLRVTTAGEWEPAALTPTSGAALCVQFFYGTLPTPRSRVCVFDKGADAPGLTFTRLDPFGNVVESRAIAATTSRADKHSLQVVFDPSATNLRQGAYRWQAQSRWPCASGSCGDAFPDHGSASARIRPLAEPRCLGAASRNPRHRCRNKALRLAVIPPPAEAVLSPNARCAIISMREPYTCQFGVRASVANRTIALVGDSHAAHWRAAVEVAAQARGWRGFSLTRSGCPLSTAPPALGKARRESCERWRRAVWRWFAHHHEVRTVFVSELSGVTVRAPAGRSPREYQIQGYLRAWRRLPKSVRQIIVLRDTPVTTPNASVCVQQAVIDHRRPGSACAITRAKAVRRDPAVVAARRPGMPRVHVIDLTRFMCSPRLCFPVVGGVLVHKDTTHLTPLFSGTLGPFLLRRVIRFF